MRIDKYIKINPFYIFLPNNGENIYVSIINNIFVLFFKNN